MLIEGDVPMETAGDSEASRSRGIMVVLEEEGSREDREGGLLQLVLNISYKSALSKAEASSSSLWLSKGLLLPAVDRSSGYCMLSSISSSSCCSSNKTFVLPGTGAAAAAAGLLPAVPVTLLGAWQLDDRSQCPAMLEKWLQHPWH